MNLNKDYDFFEKLNKVFLCFENFISGYGYYLHTQETNLYGQVWTRYVGTCYFDLDNIFNFKNVQLTKIGFGEKEGWLTFYFTDEILMSVKKAYQLKDSLKFLERIESFGKEYSKEKIKKGRPDFGMFYYPLLEWKLDLE